jgi:hypothetical protein
MKIKLKQLRQDPAILDLRPVNDVFVSRYRQAMRNGDVFPQIVVDQELRIVSGNHRYQAMIAEFGEDYAVEIIKERFADEASRIERAVIDNAKHGNPLDGISRKRAVLRLTQLGRTAESIAKLLGVSCKRVAELAGMSVIVVGGDGGKAKPIAQPIKRGLEHIAGQNVTPAQYEQHRQKDRGVPAKQAAQQLIRWIKSGWIDQSDTETIDALHELKELIAKEIN